MAKYARKSTRKFSKRRGRGRTRRGRRTRGGFTKRVLAVVRKTRETKIVRQSGDFLLGTDIVGPGLTSSGSIHKFFPNIRQDITKRGRIGAKITATKLTVKFWVQYAPNSYGVTTANDCNVTGRLWIMRQKNIASDKTVANNISTVTIPFFHQGQLLRADDEVPAGGKAFEYSGHYNNIMSPLNTDLFASAMEKKMNLKNNYWVASPFTEGANAVPAPTNFKKFTKTFRWKNGHTFNYDGPLAIQPHAWPYFITGGYSNTNGTDPIDGNMKVFYSAVLTYTDA